MADGRPPLKFSINEILADESTPHHRTHPQDALACPPEQPQSLVEFDPSLPLFLQSPYGPAAAFLHQCSLRPLFPMHPFHQAQAWASLRASKMRRGMLRRAVFSDQQRRGLEERFQQQKYISKPDRKKLAETLGLKDSQVKIWFQNRRMKWRNTKEKEMMIKNKTAVEESTYASAPTSHPSG